MPRVWRKNYINHPKGWCLRFNGKRMLGSRGSIWDKETRESEAAIVWDEGIENEHILSSIWLQTIQLWFQSFCSSPRPSFNHIRPNMSERHFLDQFLSSHLTEKPISGIPLFTLIIFSGAHIVLGSRKSQMNRDNLADNSLKTSAYHTQLA